ncbi:MAG: hypothetical protein P9X24_09175 [Candidatus Hatepunaea meridiana]|nr:hypothetical protein [Candidatus Hatepunaea meridiana]
MQIQQLTLFNITDPHPVKHSIEKYCYHLDQLVLKLKIAFEDRGDIDVELRKEEN